MAPIIEYPAQQCEAAPNSMVIFCQFDIVASKCLVKSGPIECVWFCDLLNLIVSVIKNLSWELASKDVCIGNRDILPEYSQ